MPARAVNPSPPGCPLREAGSPMTRSRRNHPCTRPPRSRRGLRSRRHKPTRASAPLATPTGQTSWPMPPAPGAPGRPGVLIGTAARAGPLPYGRGSDWARAPRGIRTSGFADERPRPCPGAPGAFRRLRVSVRLRRISAFRRFGVSAFSLRGSEHEYRVSSRSGGPTCIRRLPDRRRRRPFSGIFGYLHLSFFW